jgi:hypothetical protein
MKTFRFTPQIVNLTLVVLLGIAMPNCHVNAAEDHADHAHDEHGHEAEEHKKEKEHGHKEKEDGHEEEAKHDHADHAKEPEAQPGKSTINSKD